MSLISHVYDLLQVSNQPVHCSIFKRGRKNSDSQTEKTQWYGDITSQIPRVPGSCHCLGRAQVYHLQVMVLMCMKITKATCVNNIRITC